MADLHASSTARPELGEHTRWNFVVIITEASAFLIGLAWVDPVVVLPLFIHELVPSTVLIGLVTTLQRLGYTLPQLPMAAILGHRPRRLPYLRWGVFLGRLPFILFVIYLWTRGVSNPALVIAFMMIGFVSVSAGNGAVAVPWQDIIAKSIPSSLRGRFFGTMQFVPALATFGVGFAVRWALGQSGPGFPLNYTILFTLAAAFFTISTIGCAVVREPIRPALDRPQSLRELIGGALPLLRRRREFRSLVLVTVLGFGLSLVMPFYIVYAKTELGVPPGMAGIYIWAAVLGGAPLSLLWGYINDRRGPRAVLRGGCILAAAVPMLALFIPSVTSLAGAHRALPYLFAVVFLAGGSTRGAFWMGTNNYLYELATHEQRPRYIALLSTFAAPRTLFPAAIGWILTFLPYRLVFALFVLLGVSAALLTWRMPQPSVDPKEAAEAGRLDTP
ncbi:MAG: MFS transporter [Armatimonadota bacterium]|nr:MAG: MFS transporter [Armatimonadota bacterium]